MTTKPRSLTYARARSIVLRRLREAGWRVDSSRIWPRALYPHTSVGTFAFYFKPQAVWAAWDQRGEPRRADAFSLWGEDIRVWAAMETSAMVTHVATMADRIADRAAGLTAAGLGGLA